MTMLTAATSQSLHLSISTQDPKSSLPPPLTAREKATGALPLLTSNSITNYTPGIKSTESRLLGQHSDVFLWSPGAYKAHIISLFGEHFLNTYCMVSHLL